MALILVVEDYPNLQNLYRAALEAVGYSVVAAGDGEQALAITKHQTPDLILLDLLTPIVDGLRFLRSYDLKAHSGTRVIVFSNMESPELHAEAKELGVDRYLTKSNFTPNEMVELVQEILEAPPKQSG